MFSNSLFVYPSVLSPVSSAPIGQRSAWCKSTLTREVKSFTAQLIQHALGEFPAALIKLQKTNKSPTELRSKGSILSTSFSSWAYRTCSSGIQSPQLHPRRLPFSDYNASVSSWQASSPSPEWLKKVEHIGACWISETQLSVDEVFRSEIKVKIQH